MSALPPKADIAAGQTDVRFVPKADIRPPLFDHLVGASGYSTTHHPFLGKNDRYGSEIVGEPLNS